MQVHKRVRYAGYEFRTVESQRDLATDNSNVRVPYRAPRGRIVDYYGQIHRILTHQAWRDGPTICLLEVQWYQLKGESEGSKNPLVLPPSGDTELVAVGNCYQVPVAVWPHNPLGLPSNLEHGLMEVIDRNQDEQM